MSSGIDVIHQEVSVTAGFTEDQNVSTTESPTPPWQATSCAGLTALNATVDGGSCPLDGGEGSPGDNASTSTVAAVAQCSEFVQPWALLLLAFPVMTVFGNVLVCLSVYRERNLRTATNFFIVSLAVADLMVAILVMPFAVYVEVGVEIPIFQIGLLFAARVQSQ